MITNRKEAFEKQTELFKDHHPFSSILTVCLDVKEACQGSSDPWDNDFLLKVKELLTARIQFWDKSFDSSRVFDGLVFLLICETVQIIDKYLREFRELRETKPIEKSLPLSKFSEKIKGADQFYVAANYDYDGGDEDLLIWIGTKSEWDKSKQLSDSYSDEEREIISQISEKLNIYESTECCFCSENEEETPETIIEKLISIGCSRNDRFTQRMTRY